MPFKPAHGSYANSVEDSTVVTPGGARLYIGTLYLFVFFHTLVGLSRITKSKYHIQKYKIKLPPKWCPSKSYSCISDLILVFRILYLYYGYGSTHRYYRDFTCTKVPVGTTE